MPQTIPPADSALRLYLDLQIATACLNEAAARLTEVLRARPSARAMAWDRDYTAACSYLEQAHKDYRMKAERVFADLPAPNRIAPSFRQPFGHNASSEPDADLAASLIAAGLRPARPSRQEPAT